MKALGAYRFLWLILPLFVAGCISPIKYGAIPHGEYVANERCRPATQPGGAFSGKPYFLVTSRLPDCRHDPVTLLSQRSDVVRFGRFGAPKELPLVDEKGKASVKKAIPLSLSDDQQWWNDLASEAKRRDGRVLLYVHGFKESFFTSARDSAQIADLSGLDIPVVHYSWPSQGELFKYVADETNMYYSERQFRNFLTRLAQQPWTKEIILVAHSLGVRLVIPALEYVDENSSNADASNISNIILASPDIDQQDFDRDIFKTILNPARVKNGRRITVYLSARDRALDVSYRLHGHPRLGRPDCFSPFEAEALENSGYPVRCYAARHNGGAPPDKSGLTIVDTTEVSRGQTGHNDYLTSAAACADFMAVINGERNRTAGRRKTRLAHVFTLPAAAKGEAPDDNQVCQRVRD